MPRNTGTLTVLIVESSHTDGQPHYGDRVTFDVQVDRAAHPKPFVQLNCYQDDELVYAMSAGFWDGYRFTKTYTLSSSFWDGGAADAVATLFVAEKQHQQVLATHEFTVLA